MWVWEKDSEEEHLIEQLKATIKFKKWPVVCHFNKTKEMYPLK